ncbi:hypothetical protein KIPB_013453, partial [Kipferlia bialata]
AVFPSIRTSTLMDTALLAIVMVVGYKAFVTVIRRYSGDLVQRELYCDRETLSADALASVMPPQKNAI